MSGNLKNEVSREKSEEMLMTTERKLITVKGVCLFEDYNEYAESIENFEVRDDDVWVCTFPKSGTTWTQEMVWCIANDLDYEAAKVPLLNRFPFFDIPITGDVREKKAEKHDIYSTIAFYGTKYFDDMPSPRFIKSHLPFHLLPRDLREGRNRPRIIHVSRNSKDTCISFYHHLMKLGKFKGDLQQLCTLFLDGKVPYGPFWEHLSSYLNEANNLKDRILFLKYEDMLKDLPSVINKTSEFLGKPKLCTEDLEKLVDHLSFEKMKKGPAMKHFREKKSSENGESRDNDEFFRCGKMNQWKTRMTPETIKKFDDWIESNFKSLNIGEKME